MTSDSYAIFACANILLIRNRYLFKVEDTCRQGCISVSLLNTSVKCCMVPPPPEAITGKVVHAPAACNIQGKALLVTIMVH